MENVKKILVIDDSTTHNFLCENIFEGNRYKVLAAETGKAGLAIIEKFMPDIVLLDLMLPKINGLTILKTIKENKNICHIPVIIVSAKDSREDIEQAFKLGALDFVKKPIGSNNLVNAVEKVFDIVPH